MAYINKDAYNNISIHVSTHCLPMKAFNFKGSILNLIAFHPHHFTMDTFSNIISFDNKANVKFVSSSTDAGQLDMKCFHRENTCLFSIHQKINFIKLYTVRDKYTLCYIV